MPFNDMHTQGTATFIGFKTEPFCKIYWLVDGVRQFKTVCFDSDEMAYNINNRTALTKGLAFEIEYTETPQEFKQVV